MEDVSLSRAHLNALTTAELIKMADSLGIDVLHESDRDSVIEELLEVASLDEDISSDSSETDFHDPVLAESVPLPRQYNITFIEVMIRDPLWAFVFWEIKAIDKEQFEKDPDFDEYYLRVSSLEELSGASTKRNEEVFKVPVKPEDTAWYLGLSPAVVDGISRSDQIQYKVELCVRIARDETILAVSSPIRLPGLPELSGAGKHGGAWENQLVRLSGYGDFHVLRKNERPYRIKGGEST